MQATQALRNQCAALLATDTTTLAAVAANKIHLVMNNFAPSENTIFTDLVFATFAGSTPLSVTAGPQAEAFNPVTLDSQIDLSAPVGGFRWQTTSALNLPQTIFGYALIDNAGAVVLASQLLDAPIVLTNFPQVIDLGDVKLTLLANSLT